MKKRILIYLFLILVFGSLYFYFTRELWFNKLSENLARADIIKKSDAVICLGGWDNFGRIKYAVELLNKGYAGKIVFLGDKIHISFIKNTWASLGKEAALKYGCPEDKIIIHQSPSSTYEEAVISKKIMDANNFTSAVVVTSPFHIYRSKKVFDKVFGDKKYRLYFSYPEDDSYLIHSWWIDEYSTVILFNEYVKIIWYKIKHKI
ncbi:MAG: YdcF family protein [Armatimonadota bacterium]